MTRRTCFWLLFHFYYVFQVIETRKFALTPGLTPKELVQEAEMLKRVDHEYIIKLEDIFQVSDTGAVSLIGPCFVEGHLESGPLWTFCGASRHYDHGRRFWWVVLLAYNMPALFLSVLENNRCVMGVGFYFFVFWGGGGNAGGQPIIAKMQV